MEKTKTNLPAFIKEIMAAKDLTYRDIEERSQGRISYGYVNSLVQGHYKNPSVDKIKALAAGLGVPEETLNKVVRGIPLDEQDEPAALVVEEAIIESGMKLTKEEKKKVIGIVKKHLKPLVDSAVEMVKTAKGA